MRPRLTVIGDKPGTRDRPFAIDPPRRDYAPVTVRRRATRSWSELLELALAVALVVILDLILVAAYLWGPS